TDVYDPMNKRTQALLGALPTVNLDNFKSLTGMESPRQFLHYRLLTGDSSDRIPGIPGVGEVTAKGLLKEFGTLEEALSKP
ncbi:5'-3' exonuclease H3TH domain-containing protein, partial [Salmonella sp. 6278]|uniref:5'-3' exonuclease H3TH domain-containing protein n=1 Tax=Salmonella sp. 6278 TaxID=3159578 RepID=UPI0039791840